MMKNGKSADFSVKKAPRSATRFHKFPKGFFSEIKEPTGVGDR
jgi:hypothetical protein